MPRHASLPAPDVVLWLSCWTRSFSGAGHIRRRRGPGDDVSRCSYLTGSIVRTNQPYSALPDRPGRGTLKSYLSAPPSDHRSMIAWFSMFLNPWRAECQSELRWPVRLLGCEQSHNALPRAQCARPWNIAHLALQSGEKLPSRQQVAGCTDKSTRKPGSGTSSHKSSWPRPHLRHERDLLRLLWHRRWGVAAPYKSARLRDSPSPIGNRA